MKGGNEVIFDALREKCKNLEVDGKDIDEVLKTVLESCGAGVNIRRSYTDSTLRSMSKNELIEYIRELEHNWGVSLWNHENQAKYFEERVAKQTKTILEGVAMILSEKKALTEKTYGVEEGVGIEIAIQAIMGFLIPKEG